MAAVLRKKCRFSLYDSTSSWMTRIFLHYDVKLTNPMMMCYASMSTSSCPPPAWTWLSSSFCRYSCLKNKLNGNHLIVKINHINHKNYLSLVFGWKLTKGWLSMNDWSMFAIAAFSFSSVIILFPWTFFRK